MVRSRSGTCAFSNALLGVFFQGAPIIVKGKAFSTKKSPWARLAGALFLAAFYASSAVSAVSCRTTMELEPAARRRPIRFEAPEAGGGRRDLASFRGRPVLVLVLASWCVPCQLMVQRLLRVQAAVGKSRLALAAVSVDERPSFAREYARALNLPFPLLVARQEDFVEAGLPRPKVIPMLLALDKRGRLRKVLVGPVSAPRLARLAEALLGSAD